MSDLALDTDGDLLITGNDLSLTTGIDAVKQHLSQRLKTFYQECFLDTSAGIPYFQQILIKNANPQVIDSIFKRVIINTPGVTQLLEFSLEFQRTTRELFLSFRAQSTDGIIDFSEAIP